MKTISNSNHHKNHDSNISLNEIFCCGGISDQAPALSDIPKSLIKWFIVSVIVFIPGIILRFGTKHTRFYHLDILIWFGATSGLIFLYPILKAIVVLISDLIVPDKYYEGKKGDYWYYIMVSLRQLVLATWIAIVWIVWTLVYGQILEADLPLTITYPLSFVNPVFGVLLLWSVVMGLKQVLMQYWVERFRSRTYVERMREVLLNLFIIESFREFKRKLKYRRRMLDEIKEVNENNRDSPDKEYLMKFSRAEHSVPFISVFSETSHELRERLRYLSVPASLKEVSSTAAATQEENFVISSYSWQCLSEHFFELIRAEDETLEEVAVDPNNASLERENTFTHRDSDLEKDYLSISGPNLKQKKYSVYMNQIDGPFSQRHGIFRLKRLRDSHRHKIDTKNLDIMSRKLARKIFRLLKSPSDDTLDIERDIMPVFAPVPQTMKSHSSKNDRKLSLELDEKEREISNSIRALLLKRSEKGQMSENEMKEFIYVSQYEKKRLLESLYGMNSAIQRLLNFQDFILFLVLCLGTLTIFGIQTFNSFSTTSSLFLSFAFLFGSTAKKVFENVIFIFFIHPYDVGDRLIVNNKPYIVHKIYLLSTLLEGFDGQLEYMPNSVLSTIDILNVRRSKNACDGYPMNFSFNTPWSKVAELANKLTQYTSDPNNPDFQGKVSGTIQGTYDMENFQVNFYATQRGTKQNWELYLNRKTKFTRLLLKYCEELKLEWKPLPKNIIDESVVPENAL